MEEVFEFGFKLIFECEWVEVFKGLAQAVLLLLCQVRRAQQNGIRGLGATVSFADAAAVAGLFEELEVGAKVVVVQGPGPVEVVDEWQEVTALDPLIAEQLTDMGPILLLDMGLIVFLVGAAAGEADRVGSVCPVAPEVVVKKLGAVIDVEAQDGERQVLFDLAYLFDHLGGALVPDRSVLGPLTENVRKCEAPDEVARQARAAMGDGVGLQKARCARLAMIGANGHQMGQQAAGGRPGGLDVACAGRAPAAC